jgi:hypothetical protein
MSRKPFVITHLDIDRALASCRLTPVEQIVMQFMREHSYGDARRRKLADPLPVDLNKHELARLTGLCRPSIIRAVSRLVADRVLIEADGGLHINKQYREWAGAHALTHAAIAYASEPRGVAPVIPPGGSAGDTPPVAPVIPPGVAPVIPPQPSPPTPPHSRTRASEDLRRFKKSPEERAETAPACEPDEIDNLAAEIVGRIWGLTEDGEPDPVTVYSVASSLRSVGPDLDHPHIRAVACRCAKKASPASYFFGVARTGGLRPDAAPTRQPHAAAAAHDAEIEAGAERLRLKLLTEFPPEREEAIRARR